MGSDVYPCPVGRRDWGDVLGSDVYPCPVGRRDWGDVVGSDVYPCPVGRRDWGDVVGSADKGLQAHILAFPWQQPHKPVVSITDKMALVI